MRKLDSGALIKAKDGLPARCVGPWSRKKLDYISGYLSLFSRAMRAKFPVRQYVDLFSGPGRCVPDDGGPEFDGSPLAALKVPFPFTGYHFVEADHEAMEALKTRVTVRCPEMLGRVHFYSGDANEKAHEVARNLSPNALCVVVIDPTGLHLSFDALRKIVAGHRCDLLYIFTEGMSVKRNEWKFLQQADSMLDRVMGDKGWRHEKGARVLHLRERLRTLGYGASPGSTVEGEVLLSNRMGVGLYYLVYASKHKRGEEFWKAVRNHVRGGQTELDLRVR